MRFDDQDTYIREKVTQVASSFGVSSRFLWDVYIATMESNFEQDLYDIAKENEQYLKYQDPRS